MSNNWKWIIVSILPMDLPRKYLLISMPHLFKRRPISSKYLLFVLRHLSRYSLHLHLILCSLLTFSHLISNRTLVRHLIEEPIKLANSNISSNLLSILDIILIGKDFRIILQQNSSLLFKNSSNFLRKWNLIFMVK